MFGLAVTLTCDLLTSKGNQFIFIPSPLPLRESGTCYHRRSHHCCHCRLSSVQWRWNCFADRMTRHTSSNSSIDNSLICDIYCSPEVLFETCVSIKFVDDDDDGTEECGKTNCRTLTVPRSIGFFTTSW